MIGIKICYMFAIISEAVIVHLYFDYLFTAKWHPAVSVVTFLGWFLMLRVDLLIHPILNICSFFLIALGLLFFNYRCNPRNGLFHVFLLTILMILANLISNLLMSVFGHIFLELTKNIATELPLIIISNLLYLILALLTVQFFLSRKKNELEPKKVWVLCISPVISVGISMLICYLGIHTILTEATQTIIAVNLLSLLVMNLVCLMLSRHLQRANAERTALQLSLLQEEANAAYYRATQEQTEKHRILLHDIKNHIGAIQTLAEEDHSEKIRAYLSELEYTFLASADILRMSSDPILNAILLRTSQTCKENQILFDCDVRAGCTASLDAVAITALYGNLLSNAVEGAIHSQAKTIELSAIWNYAQNSVTISVVNSCDVPPIPDGKGSWLSRKGHLELRGVGLKSIERVLSRHNGVSKIYYDNERRLFHHIIHIPFPRDRKQEGQG